MSDRLASLIERKPCWLRSSNQLTPETTTVILTRTIAPKVKTPVVGTSRKTAMQSPCPERLHGCTAGANALHGCHRRVSSSSAIKYRIGYASRAAVQAQRAQRLPACLAHNASTMASMSAAASFVFLSGHTHQYPSPAPRRSSTTIIGL
jgi:hypothetical protein